MRYLETNNNKSTILQSKHALGPVGTPLYVYVGNTNMRIPGGGLNGIEYIVFRHIVKRKRRAEKYIQINKYEYAYSAGGGLFRKNSSAAGNQSIKDPHKATHTRAEEKPHPSATSGVANRRRHPAEGRGCARRAPPRSALTKARTNH